MNCPCCGRTMETGVFHDRGDSYFLPEGESAPALWTRKVLEKKHAVLLPPESFGAPWAQRPAAFWCGQCRALLVDYAKLLSGTVEQDDIGKD